jgi:hypothetical protein
MLHGNPHPDSTLYGAVAASPFRVAPEAADRLQLEIEQRNIELEFTAAPDVLADYVPTRATVRLGVSFLSALWAAAYAYIVAYHEYQHAQRTGAKYFALGSVPRLAEAYRLYQQALDAVSRR